jgi:hypothetical protein
MDFMRALSFPFDDDDWIVKFVVGSLMMLIGIILPFIPLGYQVYVARNVMRGKDRPLPGSDHIGQVISDGLIAFIAGLVYGIPAIILSCMLMFAGGVLGDSDIGGLLFLCLTCCLGTFLFVYSLAAAALYWMGVIRYAETGDYNEFIRFSDLWQDVRSNLGTLLGLLMYSLVFALLVAVLVPFAALVCGVGLLVLLFYAQVVSGHLIGQAGQEIARGY